MNKGLVSTTASSGVCQENNTFEGLSTRYDVISTLVDSVRHAQVAASLLQACYLAVIKPLSGCVRIACSGLMITSLLQVVNRLDAS